MPQNPIGDWGVLAFDLFRPLVPLTVRVQVGPLLPEAIFTGYVTGQHAVYSDAPGGTYLRVTGMDATLRMNLQEKVQPWPSMPDSAIAAAIFGQYGVIPKVQPTGPVLVEPEGTTIQRGTDIRFLRASPGATGSTATSSPSRRPGSRSGISNRARWSASRRRCISVAMGDDTNVADFEVRYDMVRPTGAIGATLDVATKAPQPAVAPVSTEVPLGLEPTLDADHPAAARPTDRHGADPGRGPSDRRARRSPTARRGRSIATGRSGPMSACCVRAGS